ncbi:MAG: hypothetical protein AABZ47_00045, partial [Planctomycetota bacterium]
MWIRYQDANNGYKVEFYDSEIWLKKVVKGQWSTVAVAFVGADLSTVSVSYNPNSPDRIKVYVAGTLAINVEESTFKTGKAALSGWSPKFDNLKVGTDANSDGDLNDVGDTVVINEDFGSTDTAVTYDKAGNLIDDGQLQYVYDGWNRLVKVRFSKATSTTIQTAEFDGLGRRIKKVVSNSGEFDGTVVYFYDGQKIVETRNGSGNVYQQFIHGTQYIDELIQMRVKGERSEREHVATGKASTDACVRRATCPQGVSTKRTTGGKGDRYVHQDANWNVIALTDLGGSVVERYVYKPYGQVTVHQDTGYGDRDGDGDVDSTDKGTVGVT